jgi:hypothetical protein
MNETWNLDTKTEIKNIEWVQDPKLNIAGIKWNLRPPMEKALKKNEDKIIEKLDSSIGDLINLRKIVEKLWMDIQKANQNKQEGRSCLVKSRIDRYGRPDPTKIKRYFDDRGRVEVFVADCIGFSRSNEEPSSIATIPPKEKKRSRACCPRPGYCAI